MEPHMDLHITHCDTDDCVVMFKAIVASNGELVNSGDYIEIGHAVDQVFHQPLQQLHCIF